MNLSNWKNLGKLHQIGAHQLFVIDQGQEEQTMVILHGYPTSTYDYNKVLPVLSKYYRVVLHDHLGYGFSDKPKNYSYSLIEQADYALTLWQKLGLQDVHLLAHDYGTSVATEILAKAQFGHKPINIKQLTLCNGSMHIELAKLRIIQKLLKSKRWGTLTAKLSTRSTFVRNMRKVFYNPNKVDKEELHDMWELLIYKNGKSVLPKLTRYIDERYLYWNRWIGALKQTEIPTHVVWATEDPVAVKTIAETVHGEMKNSRLTWLEETGHFPMLERPKEWTEMVLSWSSNLFD